LLSQYSDEIRAGCPRNWGSIAGRLLYSVRTQPSVQWVAGPGLEADHSPPFSDEVKNGEAMTPLTNTSSWRGD
jgi:hypothetical protein